jgi:tetratricopeptide (TPR) repeat protein
MADHHLYMPSMGFFLIIGVVLDRFLGNNLAPLLKKSFIFFIFIFYISLTILQHNYWLNPILFYQRTLQFSPNSFSCHHNLGRLYIKNKQFGKAVEHFKKAIALNHYKVYLAYDALGTVIREQGNLEKAATYFQKAIDARPNYVPAYNHLGNIYREMDKLDHSLAVLQKSIQMNQYNAAGHYSLGLTYFLMKHYKKAEAEFFKTLDISSKHHRAYFHLAVIAKIQGDLPHAEEWLRKGFPLEKDFQRAYDELKALR